MSFEIIFVTEGPAPASTPAADIHFGQQRVCLVRRTATGEAALFFDGGNRLGRPTRLTYAWSDFQAVVEEALIALANWQRGLTVAGLG